MSERAFQCTPAAWNQDRTLNRVSWEAEYLFRRIALECDRYWRVAVDGENIAHSIRCTCFAPQRRFSAWSLPKIARYLDELLAAGIVRRLVQRDRCWIEVGEWLRYVKGSASPSVPERTDQPELELPAALFALPPANGPPNRPSESSHSSATSTTDKDKTSTRAQRARETELLGSLAEILPPREMHQNGGMWRQRIRHNSRAVAYAIEDWKLRTPDQRRAIKNAAAWLTDRHARALVELQRKSA